MLEITSDKNYNPFLPRESLREYSGRRASGPTARGWPPPPVARARRARRPPRGRRRGPSPRRAAGSCTRRRGLQRRQWLSAPAPHAAAMAYGAFAVSGAILRERKTQIFSWRAVPQTPSASQVAEGGAPRGTALGTWSGSPGAPSARSWQRSHSVQGLPHRRLGIKRRAPSKYASGSVIKWMSGGTNNYVSGSVIKCMSGRTNMSVKLVYSG